MVTSLTPLQEAEHTRVHHGPRSPDRPRAVVRLGYGMVATLLIALMCSCGHRVTGLGTPATPPEKPGKYDTIDFPEAMSVDGRTIAFRRVVESSYGPPGLYVVRLTGGQPRYLMPADYFWPSSCRFSPDGRQLVGVAGFEVVLIDLSTGAIRWPFFTNNGVNYVDWSPDGQTLLCSRTFTYPGQVEDSAGIHLYDLRTGVDQPFRSRGRHVYGRFPAWSGDGQRFALVESFEGYQRIAVYAVAQEIVTVLVPTISTAIYDNLQWIRASRGYQEHLVYQQIAGDGGGPYAVYMDGSRERLQRPIRPTDVFSSDGATVLTTAPDPVDSIGVIFLLCTGRGHCKGATRVQVTAWRPASLRMK